MAWWVWRLWDVCVAAVIALAVIAKVLRPQETLSTLRWVGFGAQSAWAVLYLLLAVETLIVVRLLLFPTGAMRKITVCLLVLFSVFLSFLWFQPEPPSCGCGSVSWLVAIDADPLSALLRNGTILVGAMIAATVNLGWNATGRKGVP